MTRITVDESLRSKLNRFTESLELCDDRGLVVGHFLPDEEYQKILYGSLTIPFSEEEVSRRRKESGGRELPEIWDRLNRS